MYNPHQVPPEPRVSEKGERPISVLSFWTSEGLTQAESLSLRRGIVMSMGDFQEMLSQAILVGIILVGRFGRI